VLLPRQHELRAELYEEVHARPPESLVPPVRASQVALLHPLGMDRAAPWEALRQLCERYGVTLPPATASHFSADFGAFRLKWERHTEFTRWMAIVQGAGDDPFADPAIAALPPDWLARLPGELLVATHVALLPAPDGEPDATAIAERLFGGGQLIGAPLLGGRGFAFTDFRTHADGFGRFVAYDHGTTSWQAGRIVQRLLEIDTYRIMALLALPVARALVPALTESERELAEITASLIGSRDEDEPGLLERLTTMAAETESREAQHRYRFGASAAYYDLVQQRIVDLREGRIEGLPTFSEFTERRLAPAMNTCRAVARRQEQLAARIARATQLLSTRVDLTRQQQNQALLASMDRRARLQLRLQQTVEGLSVAAITYYVVGLIAYAVRGLGALGLGVSYEVLVAASTPLVALAVFLGMRQVRRRAVGHAD